MSTPVIPDAALDVHIGILGKTGSGKTYTAKGLVERLLTLQRQVVIIDPTGAWYGLRTKFEIPIFGGRHGDIEISDTAGAAVAGVIVEQHTSAIVDLSLLSARAQRRFMRDFAHEIRKKPPGAFYFVIDEADEFLPQQLPNDMTNLFGDLKWMVRRGRLNGFRVMMITQRPAEIAKAVLTQIETLVAHRLTAPQDRKAIEEWVKGHHDPAEAREVLSTLASLEKGEAWVWSPDLGLLQRAHMPAIATFDSGRTPEPGEEDLAPPNLAELDLSALKGLIEAAPDSKVPADPAQAFAKGNAVGELLAKKDARIAELETALAAARRESKSYHLQRDLCIYRLQDICGQAFISAADFDRAGATDMAHERSVIDRVFGSRAKFGVEAPPDDLGGVEPASRPSGERSPEPPSAHSPPDGGTIRGRKALAVLAGIAPARLSEAQWATLAGYAKTGGTWSTYKGELRRSGLVDAADGLFWATQAGVEAAGASGAPLPPKGPALAAFWGSRVPGVKRMVDVLVRRWPHLTTRDGLAADLGMAAGGGTFSTYLGRLRTNGLLEEQGKRLRLSPSIMGTPA